MNARLRGEAEEDERRKKKRNASGRFSPHGATCRFGQWGRCARDWPASLAALAQKEGDSAYISITWRLLRPQMDGCRGCFLLRADVPPELSTAPCPLFEKGKLFSYISPRTQDSSSGLFCPAGFFCFRFTAASAGSTYPSPRIQANALRTPFPCTAEGRVSRMDPMRAQVITSTNRSPPFQPFQRPRLTPDFHAESTAARKKYRKRLRLLLRNTNGNPAAAPLRKNRCVGRTDRGSVEFQRQMLPHAEPTEAERMAVKEMIRFDRLLTEVMG